MKARAVRTVLSNMEHIVQKYAKWLTYFSRVIYTAAVVFSTRR